MSLGPEPELIEQLGAVLVSAQIEIEPTSDLSHQHRQITRRYTDRGDALTAYIQMGFLALKAIEKARRCERALP